MYLAVMCWLQVVIQEQFGFTPTWGCWCETNTPEVVSQNSMSLQHVPNPGGNEMGGAAVHSALQTETHLLFCVVFAGHWKGFHIKIDLFHSDLCAPFKIRL